MPEQLMYISWDIDTGDITRISGAPIPNSISVPLSLIAKVEMGEESAKKYSVKYNTKFKKYELVNNENYDLVTHDINDSIYLINPNITDTADITITQDIKNKTWAFNITEPQNIDKTIWFAAVQKDNPNILVRSFKVNLVQLSKQDIVFDFINAREEGSKDVSICTTRTFDEYNFIQVTHESN